MIGKEFLKKVFKNTGSDRVLYFMCIFLCVFGIVMIGDASVGMANKYGTAYAAINMIKQIIFVCAGTIGMTFLAHNYKKRKLSGKFLKLMYFIVLMSMFICLLWVINGTHAWIVLGPVTIQPVEFMKLTIILYLSYAFGELPRHYDFRKGSQKLKNELQDKLLKQCLVYPIAMAGFAFLVCAFIQKDLGSALIIGGISYVIFLCTDYSFFQKFKRLTYILIIALPVVFLMYSGLLKSHQLSRIDSWLHPLRDIYGQSYQIVNGLVGYVSGGLLGKGFGSSVMKFGYIPEAQNDYISAIIMEELGLIGFACIMIPYCYIIFVCFRYVFKVKESSDKLTLIGIAAYFLTHLFVNIGGVSGLIPMTGVPLLLISAGGSSTVVALLSIGIIQSIITKHNRDQLKEDYEYGL